MEVKEKIRMMREMKQWTQEDMAERLHMSLNSYAKLERGESKIYLEKLEKISEVLGVDLVDLLSLNRQGLIWLINGDSNHNINYYVNANANEFSVEVEKLHLMLSHKNEIIEQKDKLINQQASQIDTLSKLVRNLEK